MRYRKLHFMNFVLSGMLVGSSVIASELFVYPGQGQSDAQMEQDKFNCYQWAKQNTGFDPTNPPQVAAPATGTEPYRPAGNVARGAARGAVIAGIADGDAGKGAAVGAIGGGVRGRAQHQRRVEAQRQQAASQQSAQLDGMRNDYNRAYSACLEGRGYTVK